MVLVLAHQSTFNALCSCCQVFPHGADVDKKPGLGINPPAIDHIQSVLRSTYGVVGVDFEQIAAAGRQARNGKVIFSHIVVLGEEGDGLLVNLEVKIGIPGENLRRSMRSTLPLD